MTPAAGTVLELRVRAEPAEVRDAVAPFDLADVRRHGLHDPAPSSPGV